MKFKTDYNYALNHNLIGSYDLKKHIATFLEVPDYTATAGKVYTKSGLESNDNEPTINSLLEILYRLSLQSSDSTTVSLMHLKSLLPMASEDATRRYLQGVYFDFDNGALVATDGHILRIISNSLAAPAFGNVIIPSAAIHAILKVSKKLGHVTLFKLNDGYYSLSASGCTVVFKVIERDYPRYQDIVPSKLPEKFLCLSEMDISWIKDVAKAAKADKGRIPIIKIADGIISCFNGNMKRHIIGAKGLEFTFNAFKAAKVLMDGELYINTESRMSVQKEGDITNVLMGTIERRNL